MPAQAIGPLLAALVVIPNGQGNAAWFALAAVIGIVILSRVGRLVPGPSGGAARRRYGRAAPVAGGAQPGDHGASACWWR